MPRLTANRIAEEVGDLKEQKGGESGEKGWFA
jgi:hypothetical protein